MGNTRDSFVNIFGNSEPIKTEATIKEIGKLRIITAFQNEKNDAAKNPTKKRTTKGT